MNNFFKAKSKLLAELFLVSILCGVILGLMRVQESYYLETALYEKYGAYSMLFNTSLVELKATIFFSLFLLPFVFVFKRIKYLTIIFFLFVVIANSLLIQYFLTNFDLVGNELLIFSFSELQFILSAEKSEVTIFQMILFLFHPIMFLIIVSFLYKYIENVGKKGTYVAFTIYMLFLFYITVDFKNFLPNYTKFNSYQKFTISNNKMIYFFGDIINKRFIPTEPEVDISLESQIEDYQKTNPHFNYIDKEFPLMHNEDYTNVLGPFFTKEEKKPNIVFVLVESLSRSFSGPNAHLGSFTPFLDSLMSKSLYWENSFSNAERTYGVLPNVFSSAPFFDQFVNNEKYVNHNSLITELKNQGYYSDFHYGGWESFGSRGRFVKHSGLDTFYSDQSFDTTKFKIHHESDANYHWGYDDKDLLEQYFIHTKEIQEPFLSMVLTLSMHSPYEVDDVFSIQDAKKYLGEGLTDYQNRLFDAHPEKIKSIAFVDKHLKKFFETYKKQDSYKNTIFVILGDHNIHSLPLKNELDFFHTPLMIYSELLNTNKSFKGVTTHKEITPSLLGLLENNYNLEFSENKHWLGTELDTSAVFRSEINTSICLGFSKYVEYIYKDNFVLKDHVFKFDSLLNISLQEDTLISNKVMKLYKDYTRIEEYMLENDRLYKQ